MRALGGLGLPATTVGGALADGWPVVGTAFKVKVLRFIKIPQVISRDEKHVEAVQCRKGLNLLLSRLPNVLGRAASVLGCHGCGFQEQVPAGLLSVWVRNMQLDEVDVLTNHPSDCSGQFAGDG